VDGQRHAPADFSPGKTQYPLYRRLGGSQGRSGRVRKISPPPGFDPPIVQPVASRYADSDIPAPNTNKYLHLVNTIPMCVYTVQQSQTAQQNLSY
jgi:hypothetical protein